MSTSCNASASTNSTNGTVTDLLCSTIVSNSDISGVGVRVAIYVQTILSMTVVSFLPYHEKAFRATSRNTYVVSISLIIASLIQWKTSGLSLLDGIVVTMLTTIMTVFITINNPYIRTLGLSINTSSLLFTVFWCYWGLQIWADPASFGIPEGKSPAECPASVNTVFVISSQNISVQNGGLRGFAIFIFGVGSIMAILALLQCIVWSLRYALGTARAMKDHTAMRFEMELRQRRYRSMSRGQLITRFGGLAVMIYMIVTTEQIVARNSRGSELGKWTYSQTIALIMLGQQIMECMSYFREEIKHQRNSESWPW